MPKPIVNNKINYQNIYGLVAKLNGFINQGVKDGDSPVFTNLTLKGDGTIRGNLYVEGNTTILNTNVIEFEDNIILLNRLETGSGVTLNQSGLEIERGSLENYRMIYNEIDNTFRIGIVSNLQAVATREDNPLQNGIMMWNNATKRLDSKSTISIDLELNSTTNSTSTSTGAFLLSGGIGIQKDIWTNGKMYLRGSSHTSNSVIWTNTTTNTLNLTSTSDINITPSTKINIPYNKSIILGADSQSIVADSLTKNISITGGGNIDFNLDFGKKIRIGNQIPITFATQSEQIYTDSSNNMVIGSGQNIHLTPGANRKVIIPLDIGLSFSNNNQQISANLNNDLSIIAGNNILLTPGPTLDVRIPTDNGIKFGNSGNQRITSDSNNDFTILSSSDIYLTANGKINIPNNVFLTFGTASQYIRSVTDDLYIKTDGKINIESDIHITSTTESENGTTGSMTVSGGLSVVKTIYTESGIIVDSNEPTSLLVRKNNNAQNVFLVGSNNDGRVEIIAGDGDSANPSVKIKTTSLINAKSLIELKAQYDNTDGYMIGRGSNSLNSGRSLTVNIPRFDEYSYTGDIPKFSITTDDCTTELFSIESETGNIISKGTFGLLDTRQAVNATTASFVITGGLGVVKNIIVDGDYTSNTDSEYAINIKNKFTDASVFRVDTKFNVVTANANLIINNTSSSLFSVNNIFKIDSVSNRLDNSLTNYYYDTTQSVSTSTGAVVISGGVGITKQLYVGETSYFNTINMNNTRIRNVADPVSLQDVATKAYVDLASLKGLYIKQSVETASLNSGNLSTDFLPGVVIDGYTLQVDDRILIKDQDDARENGIYIVRTGQAPTRSLDLMTGDNAAGVFTFIKFGDLQGSTGWVCNSSNDNDIVDTHTLTFVQFSGLGQVVAGLGLSKDFNQLNVNVDDSSIEIAYDSLRIKDTFAGIGLTGGSGVALQTLSDQSHVTKLGTIDTGTWQSDVIDVLYGGTGKSFFNQGSIIFGNGIELETDSKLYYDSTNLRLGLGTNQPSKTLHISSSNDASLLLNADSDGISVLSKPEMIFSYNGDIKTYIGLTRTSNEYASNIYAESLVISHDKSNTTSIIQFATQKQNRMTILSNGNVGINTSNPTSKLQVIGTLSTTDINSFNSTVDSVNVSNGAVVISGGIGIRKACNIGGKMRISDNTPSTSLNTASVIVQGGLSIQGNQNAVNVGNGGGLTVAGGTSIGGDLYVGGSINGSGSSSSTYAYLTLTATDEAVNFSTGSLLTFGGITIQGTTNSSSLTNGGTILTEGGASIGADVYIGGNTNLYGYTNYYGNGNIVNFFDENVIKRFSLDRDNSSSSFSLSRYSINGIFVEKTFTVDNSTGSILFANEIPSSSNTTASFILNGGISINHTSVATSVTSGGSLTIAGGVGIQKNVMVGGDIACFSTTNSIDTSTGALVVSGGIAIQKDVNVGGKMTVDKSVTLNDKLDYNGGGLLDVIINNTSNAVWHYFGRVTDFCEIDFYNSNVLYGLKVNIKIKNFVCNMKHNYYGDNDVDKLKVFVYQDPSSNYYLFTKTPALSTINVNVRGNTGNKITILYEGDGDEPDGFDSGYNNTWLQTHTTLNISNLAYNFGNVTVEGLNFNVADNFPVIGYNNSNTTNSRNLGLAFQRYQSSNDTGTGELVTDQYVLYDSIPNQSSANSLQIKFSNLTSNIDNYYTGWWIKIASGANINQVRKIISYNGGQRVATLDTEWTTRNPEDGATVYFYNGQYLSFYFDDSKKSFELVYNTRDNVTRAVTSYDYVNLNAKGLYLSDTTASLNSTTGSIRTLGGISINNTNDSSSCTQGGALTALGGASVSKKLYVGENVAIGQSGFTPSGSIHIKQYTSSIVLENGTNSNSYIQFMETGTSDRFGILSDSLTNEFYITLTGSNNTPESSRRLLTATSDGYIGINTTSNINSPLTIKSNQFISADTNTGFLGLVGGSSNINNSISGGRVVMYGNDAIGSGGNVTIMSGTSGSVQIYTNADKERVRVDQDGRVSIFATTYSNSATSGSLVVSGSVAVSGTENSSSPSAGGTLTVAGGASIMKDIHIGGNLYIAGNLDAGGSSTEPEITFVNNINCTYTGYDNSKLLILSQEAIFSFVVWVTPSVSSANCQIEFNIPSRETVFENRSEYIASCSGYTDDDEVIPLFNCISVGVKNQTRGLIKFQSVSTGIHYFNIICRYTISNV